ncbi:MAG: matrixin family metalloprotease, partial [Vicinamibacterales bacterium]
MTSPRCRRTACRALALACAALIGLLATPAPASAYLKFGLDVNGRSVTLKWGRVPVRYWVTERGTDHVTAPEMRDALGRAFAAWQAVPSATIAYAFAGFTDARPGDDDGRSTLGFEDRPDLDRVLASTSFLIDDVTGELLESDIFFNTAFPWSASPEGEAGFFDLESIAVHEIGHLSGLGHSAIGETAFAEGGRRVTAAESVMFPIAFAPGSTAGRVLKADDIAGISDLYPDETFLDRTGSLSGRVTRDGRAIFGAHVVAFNPRTGALVGGFTLNGNGQFSIGGLSPGPHVVRVEPLDDVDVESFFDGSAPVALDIRVAVHPRLVTVP